MRRLKEVIKDETGGAGMWVIVGMVLLLLVVFPVLSQTIERNRINIVRNDTVTAVDLALRSAIISLEEYNASSRDHAFDSVEFRGTFQDYLIRNMKLGADLTATDASLVDGPVKINDLDYHGSADLPYTSPVTGKTFTRPYFSVELELIIAPSLYRQVIQSMFGIDGFHYTFYYDVSIPIDIN